MIADIIRPYLNRNQFDCLLLTHPDVRRLAEVQEELTAWASLDAVNVGLELSQHLIDQPRAERARQSDQWLHDRLAEAPAGSPDRRPALLVNIDLLFEPSLNLDPLLLFRQAARARPILALWPGNRLGDVLTYALPEHHHYRTFQSPDALVFQVP